ncbi:MAG: hypothetical protein AABY07_02555 [Nanoarchaeota archaeon]
MRIAILGAGPSGMMAAHAAFQCGSLVDIFDSNPDQIRRNSGVYYLHDDCDLLLDSVDIKQTILGIELLSLDQISEIYTKKVYGNIAGVSKVSVLDAIKNPTVKGYNAGQAISRLWDLYGERVREVKITNLDHVLSLLNSYDKIISTIPAGILYPDYKYESVNVLIKSSVAPLSDSFIFYNVNLNCNWYRCSAIFGIFTQEYDYGVIEQNELNCQYRMVKKVVGNGIKSNIENLFLVGRYGAWRKSTLTHNVYYDVLEWLRNA